MLFPNFEENWTGRCERVERLASPNFRKILENEISQKIDDSFQFPGNLECAVRKFP